MLIGLSRVDGPDGCRLKAESSRDGRWVGGLFYFCFNLVFLSRYMQPVGLWQRQDAAAPRKQETAANFSSTVYPFPTPEPARAVIVGVSQHLLLPMFRRKALPQTKEKRTQLQHPHKRAETERKGKTRLLTNSPQLRAPRLLPPPSRPPVRPPPRRPGPQHQETPSSFPLMVGVATSTPSMHAGQSS